MSTVAEVKLWGRTIGAVSLEEGQEVAAFEYDPAFDMTYSFNPSGEWTASHQMTVNGKRDNFTMEDFKACAKVASMKRGRAETIVNEVLETVSRWRDYADEADVPTPRRDQIQHALRLKGF